MSSQVAIEMGLLKPVEIEIVEAFIAPNDLAPGYELLDVLGYGALGVVYRAHQPRLRRDVAIKSIIQPLSQQNSVARFQQEGAAIGRLQHPNIVSAYDSGSHRNRLYLVMELVEGADLRQRLRSGPLETSMALSILRQTASGLAHAFAHQIIHRDIKPGNLILTDAPAGFDLPKGVPLVKIADFGLARLNPPGGPEDEDTRLTMTGAALGTPMYCAPEQLTGDEIDHRSDIYGLGATLFHMLSATTPFESDKVSKIIAAKVTGQPPRLERLPDDLDPDVRQLLLDMMNHDPKQRVPDYETLIARIDEIQPHLSSAISSGPMKVDSVAGHRTKSLARAGTRGRMRRMRRLLPVLGIVAVICLGAIGLSAVWNRSRTPDMVAAGWELPLFDGKTLTGWTDQTGLWFGDTDSEGGLILVGKGSLLRPFPRFPQSESQPSTGHGFRIGIDLPPSSTAEVHFGFDGPDAQSDDRLVMQYSGKEIALGRRKGVDGDFDKIGHATQLKAGPTDVPAYHEVRAELHGDHWFAYFDGNFVADAPANADANNLGLQLVALDGDAHFEGPSVYGLKTNETAGE
ncbi:MAG: protein kinase domain-containing protein [Rubripirellula sp.]